MNQQLEIRSAVSVYHFKVGHRCDFSACNLYLNKIITQTAKCVSSSAELNIEKLLFAVICNHLGIRSDSKLGHTVCSSKRWQFESDYRRKSVKSQLMSETAYGIYFCENETY